jgi:uncharacterized Tic20 family protein
MATARSQRRPLGSGWFTFAGIMFGLAGVSNLLWGIGALDSKEYLPENGLLASNLTFWGWMSLVWAVIALIGAYLLFTRAATSAGIGIVLAGIHAIFWLFALPVLPIWSLVVMTIDILIIYGLAVHSDVVDT